MRCLVYQYNYFGFPILHHPHHPQGPTYIILMFNEGSPIKQCVFLIDRTFQVIILLAGDAGFEPTKCRRQRAMPYRLANPLCS